MSTIRYEQSELNVVAARQAHKFQAETLAKMLEMGWQVQTVKSIVMGIRVTVVTVSHPHGGFGMICPNGMFARPIKGKKSVSWNWQKMKDLAEATIPCAIVPTSTR